MTTIGKVKEITKEIECDFEWKIDNFMSILEENKEFHFSQEFTFADATWNLKIYPNGQVKNDSIGYISLYLMLKKFCGQAISLDYTFFIETGDKTTETDCVRSYVFKKIDNGFGAPKFLSRSELLQRRSELVPNDAVTIICSMKYVKSLDSSISQAHKCSYCEQTLYAVSYHQRRCLEKPIKCPECGDIVKLRNWYGHVCQSETEIVTEKMLDYFKDIMISGEHSDTIIQVRDVEFRLHRIILTSRNPYFRAMFKNEMKEKATGIVNVDDCEPDIFRQFIHFLYTGKLEDVSQENIRSLYEVADKYQDEELKKKCLNFMIDIISVENFCKFFALALKFDDKKLFEKAVEFFISRASDIVQHVSWVDFLRIYPIQGNELFIKYLYRPKKENSTETKIDDKAL